MFINSANFDNFLFLFVFFISSIFNINKIKSVSIIFLINIDYISLPIIHSFESFFDFFSNLLLNFFNFHLSFNAHISDLSELNSFICLFKFLFFASNLYLFLSFAPMPVSSTSGIFGLCTLT